MGEVSRTSGANRFVWGWGGRFQLQKQVEGYDVVGHGDGHQAAVAGGHEVFGVENIVVVAVGDENTERLEGAGSTQTLEFPDGHIRIIQ